VTAKRPTADTLSPSEATRRLNPHLWRPTVAAALPEPYIAACTERSFHQPAKPRNPSTADKPANCHRALNKTESRAYEWLCAEYGDQHVWGHAVKVPLTDGQWYEPDFVAWDCHGIPKIVEVKGSHRGLHLAWSQRGMEKFKRARAEHPGLRFALLTWTGKVWKWEQHERD
jgi:hypothetical protein